MPADMLPSFPGTNETELHFYEPNIHTNWHDLVQALREDFEQQQWEQEFAAEEAAATEALGDGATDYIDPIAEEYDKLFGDLSMATSCCSAIAATRVFLSISTLHIWSTSTSSS
jgi:hypothetical protein